MRSDPAPGAACRFSEDRFVLPTGLRVRCVRRPQRPIVSVALLLPAGSASERREQAGLAALTAGLVSMGTSRRDATAWAELVDGHGASLGVAADQDFTMAALGCLAGDFPALLSLMAETLMAPAFAEEEVGRRIAEALGRLVRRRDDAGSLVRNRLLAEIFGDHPYGHPPEGTTESLERLDRSDILRFHAAHYGPEGAILAVVGDVEFAAVRELVGRCFQGWGPGGTGSPPLAALPAARPAVHRLQKEDRAQAWIRVGHLAPPRRDPDHLAGLVLNFVLGGSGPGSRLMRRLREERGIVYDARSSLVGRQLSGYFFASARTGRETMDEARAALVEEVARLRDSGVSAGELDRAQRFFSGSLPLGFETNDQLATLILTREFYGLEEEYWLRDLERMQALTPADVQAAAERLFRPDSLVTVLLADFREGSLPDPIPAR